MRLFHFSEDPGITIFRPRPVRIPVELPTAGFEEVDDVGMWVTRLAVRPIGVESFSSLRAELDRRLADHEANPSDAGFE